jgi:hypothetical protein
MAILYWASQQRCRQAGRFGDDITGKARGEEIQVGTLGGDLEVELCIKSRCRNVDDCGPPSCHSHSQSLSCHCTLSFVGIRFFPHVYLD